LVLLDFSELTLLSSLAMGLLVRFRRDLARWGGRVRIAGAQPSVRESLEVARHDSGILTAEALAALDLDKMELRSAVRSVPRSPPGVRCSDGFGATGPRSPPGARSRPSGVPGPGRSRARSRG